MKDLFDQQGNILSENDIIERLILKANWYSEFYKIKKIFRKLAEKHQTSLAHYVKIKNTWTLLHKNNIYCIKTQKSKFYYNILVKKKAEPNYMHAKWEREFMIDPSSWTKIYEDRIWNIQDKKLAEFNYKLLNNIICTRNLISKWNPRMTSLCPLCDETHTTRHLLFDCIHIQNMWALIGNILKMNITYKHIIIGTIAENDFIHDRNLVISYCTYAIFKMWIMSENNKINLTSSNIIDFIKKDLFKRTLYNEGKYFNYLCDKIITRL